MDRVAMFRRKVRHAFELPNDPFQDLETLDLLLKRHSQSEMQRKIFDVAADFVNT